MKHIHRTQLSTYSRKLAGLGIDTEMWFDFNIILEKVCGYREYLDEDSEIVPDKFTIYMVGEDSFSISTPYNVFDKIMNDYLYNK